MDDRGAVFVVTRILYQESYYHRRLFFVTNTYYKSGERNSPAYRRQWRPNSVFKLKKLDLHTHHSSTRSHRKPRMNKKQESARADGNLGTLKGLHWGSRGHQTNARPGVVASLTDDVLASKLCHNRGALRCDRVARTAGMSLGGCLHGDGMRDGQDMKARGIQETRLVRDRQSDENVSPCPGARGTPLSGRPVTAQKAICS